MSAFSLLFGVLCTVSAVCVLAFDDILYTSQPKIIGEFLDHTLTLNVGDNITLLCEGKLPVEWHVTAPGPGARTDFGVTTQDVTVEEGSNKTAKRLNLTNAQYYDTGRYICYYQEDHREEREDDSVYIFVKDPENALVPYEKAPFPMLVQVVHYRQAIIPCLVTDPNINVTLIKQAGQDIVDTRSDVKYDPKVGFTLLYPNFYFSGVFYCEAEGHDDSITVVLHYRRQQSTPLPYIIPSASQVMKGGVFSLTCYVSIDVGEGVLIEWDFQNKGLKDNFIVMKTIRERVETNNYVYENVSKELRVFNAHKGDEGVYKCRVETTNTLASHVSETVLVYEKPVVYLNPEKPIVSVTKGSKQAFLRVEMTAFPLPNITWFFNGTRIVNDHQYKKEYTEQEVVLRIFFPTPRNYGNYTLVASHSAATTATSILLYGPLELTSSRPAYQFFTLNKTYSLSCDFIGYPVGNIYWYFQECKTERCVIQEGSWKLVHRQNFTLSHTFKVTANRSGNFRCVGNNSIGGEEKDFKFIVTDQIASETGLTIVPSKPKVVKGDSLRLECHASLWQFRTVQYNGYDMMIDPGYFNSNDTDNNTMLAPVVNSSLVNTTDSEDPGFQGNTTEEVKVPGHVEVTHRRTAYSLVTTLVFHDLLPEDEANYTCFAVNFTQDRQADSYLLTLAEITSPYLLDHTTGEFRVKAMSSFSLECHFGGFPVPHISWFKDGGRLVANNSHNITINTKLASSRLIIEEVHEIHAGVYYCDGDNFGGRVQSQNMTVLVGQQTFSAGFTATHIGIVISIAVVVIIILIIIIIKVKKMKAGYHKELEQCLMQPKGDYNPDLPIDEQTACLPYDPKWEFPKDRLRLGMILGQGAFGRVMKAEAIGIVDCEDVSIVAVKMVKDCTDREQMMALLSELKILIHIGQHLNIVNLLGACTKNIRFGELYVLVEYCHFGNLRSYLLKNKASFKDTLDDDYTDPEMEKKRLAQNEKPKPYYVNKAAAPENSADLIGPPLTTKNIICWSYQVARGMEYLSAKKYIHRDLAARNVLLTEDNVVKICDFGLAKDCYKDQEYKKKGDGPVPVKWMALESFTHRIYTTKSDVWSFGILLWELFSLGGNPYPGVEINEKFIGLLKSGYRMEKPEYASDELFKIMQLCWHDDPNMRPSFSDLVSSMGDFLEANVKQYYLDLNTTYVKMIDEVGATSASSEAASDGYLKMNGCPDYTPMSPTLATPESVSLSDHEDESHPYMNQKVWRKEKSEEHELTPLHMPRNSCQKERPESPLQFDTQVDVHNPDDSDSGHSSSYAPGSSPVENNGYLVPKAVEPVETEPLVFPVKPLESEALRYPGKDNHSDVSVRSRGSSGFHSDYRDVPPPEYSAVMEDARGQNMSV